LYFLFALVVHFLFVREWNTGCLARVGADCFVGFDAIAQLYSGKQWNGNGKTLKIPHENTQKHANITEIV
jgi:hypothetical protein